ncbi:MAG: acylneuraminate cytidylyltransferase family protein [Alphaproteobacteria bacterium]|nr:acylneuraminate cytidylyltransferase family protein [Alphaproteobacteria bacterium]
MIALIPARGGSKAVPRKNIAPLAGRPLLAYTAEAALTSPVLDRVLLSTDDPAIAACGRALGLDVPFLRPAEIAGDDTPMIAVIAHALEWLRSEGQGPVEALVLLQPTSPFRTARHIAEAVALFRAREADSVVSVVALPHQFTPSSLMRMEEGRIAPFLTSGPLPNLRQKKEALWARNGPAILVLRPATIEVGRLYTERSYGYPMDRDASLDIDGPEDLALAELLLKAREHGDAP